MVHFSMKKTLAILALAMVSMGASIQVVEITEAPKYEPLQIICPASKRPIYSCNIEELYWNEPLLTFINSKNCLPSDPSIKEIIDSEAIDFPCGLNETSPVRILKEYDNRFKYQTIQIFTNKGWMPKRERPI